MLCNLILFSLVTITGPDREVRLSALFIRSFSLSSSSCLIYSSARLMYVADMSEPMDTLYSKNWRVAVSSVVSASNKAFPILLRSLIKLVKFSSYEERSLRLAGPYISFRSVLEYPDKLMIFLSEKVWNSSTKSFLPMLIKESRGRCEGKTI